MKSLFFAAAALAALTSAAGAQTLQEQMSRCLAMTGALQRLACYDAAAREAGLSTPPRTASATPPAYVPPAPQAYVPPTPRQTVSSFGAERVEHYAATQPARLDRITAEVTNFHADPYGRFTVTLSNGQVWKQIEGDVTIASYRKTTRSVIIARSVVGSYALKFNDSEKMYKVTRVQ